MYGKHVGEFLSRRLGPAYGLLALAWLSIVPIGLAAAAVWLWSRNSRSAVAGLLVGLVVAAWASAAWVGIPYLGVYPNLPGALLAAPLFEPGTPGQEGVVHLFNFTLWPIVGTDVFRARRTRARAAAPVDLTRPRRMNLGRWRTAVASDDPPPAQPPDGPVAGAVRGGGGALGAEPVSSGLPADAQHRRLLGRFGRLDQAYRRGPFPAAGRAARLPGKGIGPDGAKLPRVAASAWIRVCRIRIPPEGLSRRPRLFRAGLGAILGARTGGRGGARSVGLEAVPAPRPRAAAIVSRLRLRPPRHAGQVPGMRSEHER